MTDVRDDVELGLRERKRRATRRAILMATVELVRDRGIEGATVEEISRVADVSPRTFFNYFPSKEAALVGDPLQLPESGALDAFISGDGILLDDFAELLVASADLATEDRELMTLRRQLVHDNPHLVGLRLANMRHFEDELSEVVDRRLARTDPGLSAEARRSRARLVTFAAAGALRHAWIDWVGGADRSLPEMLRGSLRELDDAIVNDPHR